MGLNPMKLEAGDPRLQLDLPKSDFVLSYRNMHATSDLILPITLGVNVSDETLITNVETNSAKPNKWLCFNEANDVPVVICGSGPSLKNFVGVIDDLHKNGAKIIALNGAASFLAGHGIWADYQVIADARPQTVSLVGPAKEYLFASQVHPDLLDVPSTTPTLFHVDFGDIGKHLPHRDEEYVILGSHASVGNVALGVAFSLGHRSFHLFGYDSSDEDGVSHVAEQRMNNGEPKMITVFNDKTYSCSYTMQAQANVFPRIAAMYEADGCKFEVYGTGLLPDRWNYEKKKTLAQREEDKYTAMWGEKDYRTVSPGLSHVYDAISKLEIAKGDSVIDFGCGTGRATLVFKSHGMKALGVDIAPNALETDVEFMKACLWELPELQAEYGFCCDVMEHIPTEKVGDVIRGIASSCSRGAYFAIDFVPDVMGEIIGEYLHLTVRPPEWWKAQLHAHFKRVMEYPDGVFVCLH